MNSPYAKGMGASQGPREDNTRDYALWDSICAEGWEGETALMATSRLKGVRRALRGMLKLFFITLGYASKLKL